MQGWQRFVKWRERDRDVRRLVDKIEEARREWQAQKQQGKYLLEGRLLGDAKRLLKDRSESLLGEARSFVIKSLQHQRSLRLQLAGWLVIPVLVWGVPTEYFWREEVVKRDYQRIENSKGTMEKRLAVLNLAGGCWAEKQYSWVDKYFRDRIFGNCRSLNYAKLSGALLYGTNLSGVELNGTILEKAKFWRFSGFGSVPPKYNNMKGISWDNRTNWKGIWGWETVENIPPELKKQLNLP